MNAKPTDAELSILQVLWQYGTATVRTVNEVLNKSSDADEEKNENSIGYTTTLKIMQIMTEKGLLTRDESSRTHVYAAAVREDDVQQAFVSKLMDSVFRGSAMKLVLQALGTGKTSKSELEQIRALLDEEIDNKPSKTGRKK
jgi:predicted transcriptional regulator